MRYLNPIFNLTIICLLLGSNTYAEVVNIGQTYQVNEKSALEEIKQRAEKVNWKEVVNKDLIDKAYNKLRIALPRVNTNHKRNYIPFYVLEKDITDAQGNTLYPKGFRYNPLDYMFTPGRIIIIGDHVEDIEWLKTNRRAGDQIITAGGDVRLLARDHNITAFFYQPKMRERLGVERVPSLIEQVNNQFKITEVRTKKTEKVE